MESRGCSVDCPVGGVVFSREMYSLSKSFHCVVVVLFLDFQFMTMVFLAIVMAVRSTLLFAVGKFIVDVTDRDFVTSVKRTLNASADQEREDKFISL